MKRRILFTILVLGTVAVLLGVLSRKASSPAPSADQTVLPPSSSDVVAQPSQVDSSNSNAGATGRSAAAISAAGTQQTSGTVTQQILEHFESLNQPIDFTGKVFDQDTNPVAGASVELAWSYMPLERSYGTNLLSSADGSFGIHGVTGYSLSVQVHKDGYYSGQRGHGEYRFGKELPSDPGRTAELSEVFWLRKKKVGAELVTSRYGVRNELTLQVPFDGNPVKIDLLNRQPAESGQMAISNIKPAADRWKSATEWSYKLAIPDGGFVEENEEFPFEAPEAGYVPTVEFAFKRGEPAWSVKLSKSYYIKFGNPARYGRIHVETSIRSGTSLEYVVNPTGSRNLEPKNQEPKHQQFP